MGGVLPIAVVMARVMLWLLACTVALPGVGCRAVMVERLEPFSAVRPTLAGDVRLEVDPALRRERGAWVRVNERAWGDVAEVRKGDRVEVAYARLPDAPALSYEVRGFTTTGRLRVIEHRWYRDGYPDAERRLSVETYGD